jgi:hypothetical protein
MTFKEKETAIRAFRAYADQQKMAANRFRKKGELKAATECESQHSISMGLLFSFASILDEPSGTCKI